MNTFLLLSAIGYGLLFSLFAVLTERLLIIYGFVRGSTIMLAIASFVMIFIFRVLIDSNSSFYTYGLIIILALPIGANRYDISASIKKGRWWWKSENNKKDY